MPSSLGLLVVTTGALYRKVAEDIKAAISAGAYSAGTRLPSESERATQLAKLVLDIAANKTELDVQNLAAEAKTAWAARSSKGG